MRVDDIQGIHQHTSAHVSTRQHTSAHVSIPSHTLGGAEEGEGRWYRERGKWRGGERLGSVRGECVCA
jgi:hypothetical protein